MVAGAGTGTGMGTDADVAHVRDMVLKNQKKQNRENRKRFEMILV